jgi:hypothetical protein
MRDAHPVKGKVITYKHKKYEIGEIYFIPNNPELYVQLKHNGCSLNVMLNEVRQLIISTKKPL